MPVESVCVYCSSSDAVDGAYFEAARELGVEIARRKLRLVYGGTDIGLMGVVAKAAKSSGGEVIGVIPEAIRAMGIASTIDDELVVTADVRSRKAVMEDRADAFIALPGGFGTLEELLEAITHRQLRYHNKPIVLLNAAGFYDPLAALFEELFQHGFAKQKYRALYAIAATPAEAVDLAMAEVGEPLPTKWF